MTSRFHTAHAYNAFDRAIRKAESLLETRPATLLDFPQTDVRRRIAQRLVEILLAPGIRSWAEQAIMHTRRFLSAKQERKECTLNVETGAVCVDGTAFLMFLSAFLVRWLGVLAWLLHSLFHRSELLHHGGATVLLGVGPSDIWLEKSDRRFVRFCTQGPVGPLSRATRIIVQVCGSGRRSQLSQSFIRQISTTRPPALGPHSIQSRLAALRPT